MKISILGAVALVSFAFAIETAAAASSLRAKSRKWKGYNSACRGSAVSTEFELLPVQFGPYEILPHKGKPREHGKVF